MFPRKTICLGCALIALLGVCKSFAQSDNSASPQSAALDRYELVLKLNPHDDDARKGEVATAIEEAMEAKRVGKNEVALAFLLRANYWVPNDAELLTDTGIQEQAMNLISDADAALTKAQQLRPGNPKTLYAIARVKMDVNQTQASEQAWQAYLAQRPDDASAHFGYGLLLQMLQRGDDARAEFQKSIKLSPQQSESYYRLGEVARNNGQSEVAKRYYEQTIEHNSAHAGAWTGLGILAFSTKQYEDSERDLEKAVKLAPDFQPARYYHGLVLAKLGRKDDSEKELAVAVQLADAENARRTQSKRLSKEPYQPQ
ncbi:tetratricopeptide repeat protein [Alloacidobacterium dinghuense]|uniref:Tetratricopeptide repeat protein n=1 Tax=Alloacidobacterium dinghuense TaxID=2763107 RepID=A0A7G8BD52_9BACT|nr:tetratricopeptide repeat protein [Alloacidobacterium dinghuense]QNI30472.1 tetratricopeptide repeat protein [Alloacidobacterium dinghuense]